MTLQKGSPVTISCAFNGSPAPSVVWKKANEEVLPGDCVNISSCNTSTVLKIQAASYADSGPYSCFITNNMGSDSVHVELLVEGEQEMIEVLHSGCCVYVLYNGFGTVYINFLCLVDVEHSDHVSHVLFLIVLVVVGPPLPPSKLMVSGITRTQGKFRWNPPAHDGGSPVTSYELQLLQDGLRDWQPIMKLEKSARSCTVKTLEPNTSYQFRVLAINEHGYSDPSDSTDVVRTKGTCA